MKTKITEMFGVEIPLFAFTHCRDVVVEVTNAGGFGVLGGASFTPDSLEQELVWIDDHVHGKPYGVDIIIAENSVGRVKDFTPEQIASFIPQEQRTFITELLAAHGVDWPVENVVNSNISLGDADLGNAMLDVAFSHPIKLIANALGVPPQSMVDRAKASGVPVGALVGAKEHAQRQVAAGVDFLVVQGTEAGGHCGEATTMVLVPEVIDAIDNSVPVLAAGGIVNGRQMAAAMALGAAGVWTGSVWLTTPESEVSEYTKKKMLASSSRDTRRSYFRTGKPSRQLKSDWTEAYEGEGAPPPLGMPLQSMISEPALRMIDHLADQGNAGAQELATYWIGQGVGLMNKQKTTRQTVLDFAEEYVESVERMSGTLAD